MMVVPVWLLLIGILFECVAVILLGMHQASDKTTIRGKNRFHILTASMAAFLVGIVMIASFGYIMYADWEGTRHVNLSYDVFLSMNGTGIVRVSLPIPTTEALYSKLQISPPTSTRFINSTGDEPTLDVEMSENTTVHGTLYGLLSDIPVDLTRTTSSSMECWSGDCTSEVSVLVLSGSVTSVHIVLEANWGSACSGYTWMLECYAVPGAHAYQR